MAVVIEELTGCVEPDAGAPKPAPRMEGGPEPKEPEGERVRRIVRRMERRQMRLKAD